MRELIDQIRLAAALIALDIAQALLPDANFAEKDLVADLLEALGKPEGGL